MIHRLFDAGAPLRLRLALLLALCAGLTALAGVAAVLAAGLWLEPQRVEAEARELAATLASALEVPMAFDDAKAAQDMLGMLRARSDITEATVYAPDGRAVARFRGAPAAASAGDAWAALPLGGTLQVEQPIGPPGAVTGRLVLEQGLARVRHTVLLEVAAMLAGTALGLLAALALARRIARRITDPVSALAAASAAIARDGDYSRRLPDDASAGEVGHAVRAFNRMLEELQARDASLEAAVQTLESRVAERTRDLRREKERAESASRAKTSFLANMSHELRTPLNAVIGAAQLLQQSEKPVDQAHLIEIVRHSGTNLLGLIENVLDVSRIEAGELPVLCDDFHLADCLDAALATASVAARAKGLAICGIVDPALPVWVNGDAIRLRQVVLNILGNAVKFTLRGEVVLHATPGAAPGRVRIQVRDTGVGIDPAKQAEIFEPFRQADETTTRRFGGTGLGLAISRRLVRAMGGEIVVRSAAGSGSEFSFEVTLAAPAHPIAAAAPLGHRVIYVEPHEPSARALGALLQRTGCTGRRVRHAHELAALGQGAALPWLLVSTDAAEAGDVLDAADAFLRAGRVVEMTGHEGDAHAELRRRFGLVRALQKPVSRGALVSRLGAAPAARPASGPRAPMGDAGSGFILVVEDDPTNQLIVCSMLKNAGYRVLTADNGSQALQLLREHEFNLVLMDWQMPDMDGLAVTRLIRAGAVGAYGEHVPVVALTANAFAEDRTACLAAGMNDFLTKPVLASQLLGVVGRWASDPDGARHAPATVPAALEY